MESGAVLDLMRSYFIDKVPTEVLASFPEQSPRALLKESLDVVEFVVFLEDRLGQEIELNELSEALLNRSFKDLSDKVTSMLEAA